jgi:SAM-dependent methyltransferase
MNQKVIPNTYCRLCDSPDLRQFLDLGDQPPANAFVSRSEIEKEERFPLRVAICANCGFVQLTHVVDPDILFRDYVYVSSTSPLFVKHFEEYAQDVSETVGGMNGKLAVDIGSNDGILLRPFRDLGASVLGIDPATNIAKKATEDGVETWPEYFGEEMGTEIRNKKGAATSITANNVFAHIHDLNNILRGVRALLADDGVFVIETPDLIVLLRDRLFDTVYHEHLSYISIRPLIPFFKRHGLRIFDVKDVSSHGGSLRIFVCLDGGPYPETQRLKERVKKEQDLHIQDPATFTEFAKEVDGIKVELNNLLSDLMKEGKRIAGYGAPAKGNTLLNYFSIGPDTLEYIVDDNPLKQGTLTPGMHIPVVSSDELRERAPDYLLILAWNYAEAIMKKNEPFVVGGGKFIVPLPKPRVV